MRRRCVSCSLSITCSPVYFLLSFSRFQGAPPPAEAPPPSFNFITAGTDSQPASQQGRGNEPPRTARGHHLFSTAMTRYFFFCCCRCSVVIPSLSPPSPIALRRGKCSSASGENTCDRLRRRRAGADSSSPPHPSPPSQNWKRVASLVKVTVLPGREAVGLPLLVSWQRKI